MRSKVVCSSPSFSIMIFPHNLDNAPSAAFAASLPIFYHSLLSAKRPGALGPEHARAKMSIRFRVLKHQRGVTRHGRQIEGVLHEEDDVNIVRFGLGGHERSKNDETCQPTG